MVESVVSVDVDISPSDMTPGVIGRAVDTVVVTVQSVDVTACSK